MSDKKSGAATGVTQIYKETTVPLAVQPKNVIDTAEVSTPYSKKKQILATVCATFGCLLNGSVIGYSAPAIPSLLSPDSTDLYGEEFQLNAQQASWITGILSLGCFFGCILAGPIMEKIGRKKTLLFVTSSCFILGYLVIFMANHVAIVYIGRLLGGMGLGFELAVATVYIVEIASTDMRGILGCLVQFMGSLGVLITFSLGAYLDWKYLALVNGLFSVIFVVVMTFVPESPRWLILRGKEFSASRSLEWLRGRNDAAIDREIEKIKRDIAAKRRERVSLSQLRSSWRPFLVSMIMMLLLQTSGLLVLVYYAVSIFQMSSTSLDPNAASIIVAVTLLVSSLVALVVVSKLNRKVMLITSMLGMTICLVILAVCFHIDEQSRPPSARGGALGVPESAISGNSTYSTSTQTTSASSSVTAPAVAADIEIPVIERPAFLGWLPLVAVIFYLFLGNAGYGTLIWVVTAEILPPKVRSIANSIIICFAFLCGFIISKTFVDLLQGLGQSGTFFLYAAVCLVGTIFTAIFVPETRGRSLDEIQKFFEGKRGATVVAKSKEDNVETPLRPVNT